MENSSELNNYNIELKEKIKLIPSKPGIYIMKNSKKEIVYIGKAKSLKKRVKQYFASSDKFSCKVNKMISQIDDFEYIITDNEFEALVLECNLIKIHMPKYNILLKDSKGYNYIKITNEPWPKITGAFQKNDDKARYIGPYMSSWAVKKTVEEVLKVFKLPICNKNFSNFSKRPCLNFYINRCFAPCLGNVSAENYAKSINEALNFIKNGAQNTINHLNKQMKTASDNLEFELAAELRDKIKSIENINQKQKIVSNKVKNQDVIAFAIGDEKISAEVFKFANGNLVDAENFLLDFNEIITTRTEFLERYYSQKADIPPNIVIDGELNNLKLIKEFLTKKAGRLVKIHIPKKGDQLKLVEMCKNNAYEALFENQKSNNREIKVLEELAEALHLIKTPEYIEAYDISNLQGKDNVGAMVAYRNAKPLKSAYKKFKIKTVDGQDDYSSMKEMIFRRFKNLNPNAEIKIGFDKLPDLILIDGGIAHTRAAKDALKTFNFNIPVFGMVKDGKHKTRAITTDGNEIDIKSNTKIFNFITNLQNEVHRFAINYHRKLRDVKLKKSFK